MRRLSSQNPLLAAQREEAAVSPRACGPPGPTRLQDTKVRYASSLDGRACGQFMCYEDEEGLMSRTAVPLSKKGAKKKCRGSELNQ